jgi:hypothetical protein
MAQRAGCRVGRNAGCGWRGTEGNGHDNLLVGAT